ncbi:MAG: Lhr family ATP-dependent helicase, partial [Microbacteriaceae bacterium]
RFRECAARALLMPRMNPNKRTPLWQQRQRSAQLLEVARRHPTFPVILETLREVLQDVYDLPSLRRLTTAIAERRVRLVETEPAQPSPYARDLLFGYVGAFMYEGDSPLAERRAAALSVDPALLGELLGTVEMRELLDPDVIAQFEREAQRLDPERHARGVEGVADLLRTLGPLDAAEVAERLEGEGADEGLRLADARSTRFDSGLQPPLNDQTNALPSPSGALSEHSETKQAERAQRDEASPKTSTSAPPSSGSLSEHSETKQAERAQRYEASPDAQAHLDALIAARRAIPVTIAGIPRVAAIEDAARLRDALGAALPTGIPVAFLEPVADPLGDLVSRHARTHGPFTTDAVAARFGLGTAVARHTLQRLEQSGRVTSGYFLPDTAGTATENEWCDTEVLRRLRMRSLAAIRGSVEPVAPEAYARFLPDWQHLTRPLEGIDGVLAVVEQLAGVPIPASAWESLVLPSRVRDYSPALLDELTSSGEVIWSGHGTLPGRDGWVSLHPADLAPLTLPELDGEIASDSLEAGLLAALEHGGAYFAAQLKEMAGAENEQSVLEALWNLTWAGRVTNDTFAPVRTLLAGGSQAHKSVRRAPRARTFRGVSFTGNPVPRPAVTGGRWSLLPSDGTTEAATTASRRATVSAGLLLDRYGVVTRGAVQSEGTPGGFAQTYRILAGFEEAGHCRRGYVIEKLGAAQFAASTTVDRLRTFANLPDPAPRRSITLAATDPANPYGAALAWPRREGVSHRPGRKAGGLVVLVDGELVLYLERGGRTVLAFDDDPEALRAAASDLVATSRARRLETLTVEKINGEAIYGTSFATALQEAGFVATPRGFTFRKAV